MKTLIVVFTLFLTAALDAATVPKTATEAETAKATRQRIDKRAKQLKMKQDCGGRAKLFVDDLQAPSAVYHNDSYRNKVQKNFVKAFPECKNTNVRQGPKVIEKGPSK